ncbi:hypothetical protein IE53DRAFT_60556 [Violaceomyces palustris]|uniref:Uncharacterized protein n=1 Tax=Violaceomyces palustris TaxID=1673888 RepID=A0ACD0NZD4_9BASI|nr:hypothetical protein IE53DRAFT_60556 [Violaceomyces palustris]
MTSQSTQESRSDHQDDLDQRLASLSVQVSPSSEPCSLTTEIARDLISAFMPQQSSRSRSLATLSLARFSSPPFHTEDVSLVFEPLMRVNLSDSLPSNLVGALSCLVAIYSVNPSQAHEILSSDAMLQLCLQAPSDCQGTHQEKVPVRLELANLLSSAANHTPSRSLLASSTDTLDWLDHVVHGKQHTDTIEDVVLAGTACVARIKLRRSKDSSSMTGITDTESVQAISKQSMAKAKVKGNVTGAATQLMLEEETLAYGLFRRMLIDYKVHSDRGESEEQRNGLLTALEGLAYISISSSIKEALSKDMVLIKKVCSLASTPKRKPVFPTKPSEGVPTAASVYQVDPTLPQDIDFFRYDTALQFGIASIIRNVTAYKPTLSAEEKQIEKLRAMANAQASAKGTGDAVVGDDLESDDAVSERCSRLLDGDVVPTLVSIALASPPTSGPQALSSSGNVNPSTEVRNAVGASLLSLVTKQDKVKRGKVVQQGGVKALLALSVPIISQLQDSAKEEAKDTAGPTLFGSHGVQASLDLSSLQALSKLCITADPTIIFGSVRNSLAAAKPLSALFLSEESSRLQTFEAALALTNLSSLGPSAASAVANSSLEPSSKVNDHCSGSGIPSLRDVLETRIMLEDHAMLRRAYVELLCNLIQDEKTFLNWSGDSDRERDGKIASSDNGTEAVCQTGKATNKIHLLVALCAPAGVQKEASGGKAEKSEEGIQEASLATRLASSGALATLTSSPTACELFLNLKPRTINIISRIISPGTPFKDKALKGSGRWSDQAQIRELESDEDPEKFIQSTRTNSDDSDEEEVDEDAEADAERADLASYPDGAEVARASLAIRGMTIASNLVQYLDWVRSNPPTPGGGDDSAMKGPAATFEASGMVEAIRKAAVEGVNRMRSQDKTSSPDPRVSQMMGNVVRMGLESLKILGGLGIDLHV